MSHYKLKYSIISFRRYFFSWNIFLIFSCFVISLFFLFFFKNSLYAWSNAVISHPNANSHLKWHFSSFFLNKFNKKHHIRWSDSFSSFLILHILRLDLKLLNYISCFLNTFKSRKRQKWKKDVKEGKIKKLNIEIITCPAPLCLFSPFRNNACSCVHILAFSET